MTDPLEAMLDTFRELTPEALVEVKETAQEIVADTKWIPNPGPQMDAFYCEADVLLYGGEAAGGKTDLIAGLALMRHQKTLIMRRQYTDLGALIERVREIDGSWDGFNGSPPPRLRTADGRVIDFGAAAKVGDEAHWQGQPHDLLAIDEVVHFVESQVRFVMGWVRSADKDQRVRTVFASNPPIDAGGFYIIGMFRPWLDDTHHNPAQPGELRWYVTDPDGKDFEVDGPELHQFPGQDDPVIPHSRTFIPASLRDNPFLRDTGYAATLDALPEPLRSAMRDGNFMAARGDDPWQMIPTAWVRDAMARWKEQHPTDAPMSSMAIDPAGGGNDLSTIASRYDGWFSEIISKPGSETPLGQEIAALAIINRRDMAPVVVDMGGGYGGVPYMTLKENEVDVYAHKGAEGSTARTQDGKLAFYNKRTEIWWKFREALDPSQLGGSHIYLPDDQELLADLTSVNYEPIRHKGVLTIKAETKEHVVARLGRSPDKGDAVTMCWSRGPATTLGQILSRDQMGRSKKPKVVTSKDRKQRRKK